MRRIFVFPIFAVLAFAHPSLLFGLEIHFKSEVVASKDSLVLADVAEIRPVSKAEILSGLSLFPSPASGERRCYESAALKGYVMDAVFNKDAIRWGGADVICVRREGERINNVEIQSVIDAKLQSALAHLAPERVFFEARELPEVPVLPPGKVEYIVRFSDPDILKSRQVSVIIKVDGRVEQNLTAAGRVNALLPVVVANMKLSRGTVVKDFHVRTEVKNIAEYGDACLQIDEILGKRLKRAAAVNQVLGENDLEMPVVIERRQLVTMLLRKGGLQISTRGVAAADGKMGDLIMVKNRKSNRMVPCRVIGSGLAMVEF